MIITVDGPASSGKGTVAKKLAEKLGYVYLDTGAMYRSLTYYCLSQGIDVFDETAVDKALGQVKLTFDRNFDVYINGENVTEKIRTDEISSLTSQTVSTYSAVRAGVVEKERAIATEASDIVVDGRDSGSVVFPQADIKFFISASLNERAKRRALQNESLGQTTDEHIIADELAKRDQDDIIRPISPLLIPQGAIIVDTTNMEVAQTLEYVYNTVKEKQ